MQTLQADNQSPYASSTYQHADTQKYTDKLDGFDSRSDGQQLKVQ